MMPNEKYASIGVDKMMYTSAMETRSAQLYFLLFLIGGASLLSFFIFRPFLVMLVLAAIFAVVLRPIYKRIEQSMKDLPGLAAFFTILLMIVMMVIPLTLIGFQVGRDAGDLYFSLVEGSGRGELNRAFEAVTATLDRYIPGAAFTGTSLASAFDTYLKSGLVWLLSHVGGAFGGAARFFMSFFIFLIALFYFLRDGMVFKRLLIEMSPLPNTQDEKVLGELERSINAVMRGSLLIAAIQGVLTGIGFAIFGVPHSMLWGLVAAIAALIPAVGTALVIFPGVLYLFLTGASGGAIGLLIWGVIAVGLIDNFLGPMFVGKKMQLHPLIILLSVLGGLAFFGPVGLFLGPICVSLLATLLSLYNQNPVPTA
jgi:predicted PurR-regulated permease PerM